MRYTLVAISILLTLASIGQTSPSSDHKLGIKTSINFSSLLGNELTNPRPKFGYVAGPYYHYKPKNKWSFYTEILGDFRGSNFNNQDTGYARIALSYITLSLMPTYAIEETNKSISLGPYISYLGLASLYIGEQRKPNLSDNLGFSDIDLGIAAYFTIKGKNVSFQTGPKIGLLDVNRDVNFDGVSPKTGTGGIIRNISLEIGMLF